MLFMFRILLNSDNGRNLRCHPESVNKIKQLVCQPPGDVAGRGPRAADAVTRI